MSYVCMQLKISRLFLALSLAMCTCFIPVLLLESSPEVELFNRLFQKRVQDKFDEEKFVTIKGSEGTGFEHKLESYLNRVLFSHGPHNPQYWINYIMGMVMNVYDSFFGMDGKRLHFDMGKMRYDGDFVILAMEESNRIHYKAFHAMNLRREGTGKGARVRTKSPALQKRLKDDLKQELKTKINRHLNQLQSERGGADLTIESADIFKIDVTLYERTANDRRNGEYYRDLVEMIALDPGAVRDNTITGNMAFNSVSDYKEGREGIFGNDPITFPRRRSILEGGGEEVETPDRVECELMKKIRTSTPRLRDVLSWMHEEGRLTDADSITAGNYGLLQILVHNFLVLHKGTPIAQIPEASFHGFAHGALQGLFVKRFGIDVRVEYRTGKGHVDMIVLCRSKDRLTNAIPAYIEVKDASKGNAKKGMTQIEDESYAFMRPDMRTAAEHAALISVSFHEDPTQRIEAGIGRFEETPTRNFAETIIHILDQPPTAGPVVGPGSRTFIQAKEEIRKAVCYHSSRSYRTSADHINRIFFGEELDCADALEGGTHLTIPLP